MYLQFFHLDFTEHLFDNVCTIFHILLEGINMNNFPKHSLFAYTPMTFVPVIASFDTEGHIKPLYVRINGISLKIYSYYERNRYANTIEFNCKVIDDTTEETYLKPLLLTYYQAERVWTIPKQSNTEES